MGNAGPRSVFLFYPNIVDYVRLLLLVVAVCLATSHSLGFILAYALSQLMDMLDGHAARAFNQCTKFGAVLDMVLDRSSNVMLFVILSHLYPSPYSVPAFSLLALLDLCSHWTVMTSTYVTGGGSHKDLCRSPVLRLYYTPKILASVVAANEMCWLSLYILAWPEAGLAPVPRAHAFARVLLAISAPVCAFKQVVSLVQWWEACCVLSDFDIAQRQKKSLK